MGLLVGTPIFQIIVVEKCVLYIPVVYMTVVTAEVFFARSQVPVSMPVVKCRFPYRRWLFTSLNDGIKPDFYGITQGRIHSSIPLQQDVRRHSLNSRKRTEQMHDSKLTSAGIRST